MWACLHLHLCFPVEDTEEQGGQASYSPNNCFLHDFLLYTCYQDAFVSEVNIFFFVGNLALKECNLLTSIKLTLARKKTSNFKV